jgi:transposase
MKVGNKIASPYKAESRQYLLFEAALDIQAPWEVKEIRLDRERRRLDIILDFQSGSIFACSECQMSLTAYDTRMREWRHLDFFQYETHIYAPLPRTKCALCGVKTVEIPWASPQSGFTLLFEAWVVELSRAMTIKAVSNRLRISDDCIWRLLKRIFIKAISEQDLSKVSAIAIDETSWQKGHKYVSFVFDYHTKKLIFGVEGKDHPVLEQFAKHLEAHGGKRENIYAACIDMSKAFIKGIEENFPKAAITFDKFHVIKAINEALEKIRRREAQENPILKGSRWDWMKNPRKLSEAGQKRINEALSQKRLQTGKAYRLKILLQEILDAGSELTHEAGKAELKGWLRWAHRCRIPEMVEVAQMIKRHIEGILNWFKSRMTNALLEGYNSVLRAGRGVARGFRTSANVIIKSFLTAGKLDFGYPKNIWTS